MIFVSVGTAPNQFDRLLRCIDSYAADTGVETLAQIGNSVYIPKHCKWFRFASHREILAYVNQADIVVCHGGLAIISEALRAGKPLLVVPRLRMHGEHVNDHQRELAEYLARLGYLDYALDISHIRNFLENPKRHNPSLSVFETKIPLLVKEFVEQQLKGKK
jgi:UDP-N-acetylglucosamine transferase subunit ALG13